MKKILTVSLGAIMAVGAARADLASTNYVDSAINSLEAGSIKVNAEAIKNLGERVNGLPTDANVQALGDKITALEAANSVTEARIAPNAVTSAKIATGAVTADKIASGVIPTVNDGTLTIELNGSEVGTFDANSSENKSINLEVPVYTSGDNITIAENGSINVTGLGSAAFTDASAYATSDQGALAESAVKSVTTGTANGTIKVDDVDVAVKGLGSAAFSETSAYATSAQGAIVDSIAKGTIGGDGTYVLTANVVNGVVSGYQWELIERAYGN